MSSSQLFFDLLPSDLCAASNFRHVFIFLSHVESLLSVTSAGLAMALSVAMYTQQKFIRAHTGYHPFLQATILMVTSVALFFKAFGLLALTAAIILNDGEIFVACAQEDIDRIMGEEITESKDDGAIKIIGADQCEDDEANDNDTRRTDCQPMPLPTTMTGMPLVYSCGTSPATCLYRAVSTIALMEHVRRRNQNVPASFSYVRRLNNPTEVARCCFSRRQSCLLRLRHLVACYPILQLVLGAASIAFWFSSKDTRSIGGAVGLEEQCDKFKLSVPESICRSVADRLLVNSQLPSLRLFNAYMLTWAILILHTPLLLLFATWHYARVDWQMQVLAVYNVLHPSARSDGDDRNLCDDTSSSNSACSADKSADKACVCASRTTNAPNRPCQAERHMCHDSTIPTCAPPSVLQPCPNCQKRDLQRIQRKKDRIRDSVHLRRAVDKEERRRAKAEAAAATHLEANKRSSMQIRNEHRVAALEALMRKSNTNVARNEKSGNKTETDDIHIRQPPFNMPVSPTSMSFIAFPGVGSNGAGATCYEGFPVSRGASSSSVRSTRSENGSYDESNNNPFHVPTISRPASIAVVSHPTVPSIKPILQDDRRPIATRKRKHVSFPAHILRSNNSNSSILADKHVQTNVRTLVEATDESSPSFSQASNDSSGAALTTISEETFNSNMSPIPRCKKAFSWLPGSTAMSRTLEACDVAETKTMSTTTAHSAAAAPFTTSTHTGPLAKEDNEEEAEEENHAFRICIEADDTYSGPNSVTEHCVRPSLHNK